ncbi:MAG: alpha/beta hydrolase [Bacteroidales bacterium]|nr:alpha/beta hydrolase [Bacteroidales bacterium]
MKLRILFLAAALMGVGAVANAQEAFRVNVVQPEHAKVVVTPAVPEDGMVPAGTVLHVKVSDIEPGWVFDSGYYLAMGKTVRWPVNIEFMEPEFDVEVTGNIMSLGASIMEAERAEGYTVIQDIVYAQPGVKPLKYDAFIPDGAKNLPGIVIIHGGGWSSNTEDIMRGLARELIKGGKYVVFSIDYRWINNGDGDATPNTMTDLVDDCYGAILHIQKHAKEYGLNRRKIAVTGDSAGGHLSALLADAVERVGKKGFVPTYMPKGMWMCRARHWLKGIKAAAPSYGVFDAKSLAGFIQNLPEDEMTAVVPMENVPEASKRAVPQFLTLGTLDRTVGREPMEEYVELLKTKGQRVEYVLIDGASHAFFDWKPDQRTKDTFAKYGVPYAKQMQEFFDSVFYK